MRRLLPILLLTFAPTALAQSMPLKAAWVQFGPDGLGEVRAVTDAPQCPVLDVGGATVPLRMRAAKDTNFLSVCRARLPVIAKDVQLALDGLPLPLPTPDPKRIVVFGDTGCRIKGANVQDCSDPEKWPLAKIALEAAKLKPDLVIHVGDYHYRETPCPVGDKRCAGTPFGDNWAAWDADFFAPAKPLLEAAPWVFVRGNHEECARAGAGWTRLLEPYAFDANTPCREHSAPFAIALAAMNLVVMDNANAPDQTSDAKWVSTYREEFAALAHQPKPTWLLLHRPIWGAISGPLGLPVGGNATMIDALGGTGIASPVTLMLSGHIHTFEVMNYAEAKAPPQVIAGFGGDLLDETPDILKGTIFQGDSGVHVKDGFSLHGFGFLLLTQAGEGWTATVYDTNGQVERTCLFAHGRVDCPKK